MDDPTKSPAPAATGGEAQQSIQHPNHSLAEAALSRSGADPAAMAKEYVRHGFALVPIPVGGKRPLRKSWQKRAMAITTEADAAGLDGNGIGLLHAWSRTCAIDVDDWQACAEWFEARGICLASLMMADDAVQIRGRPERAKLLYRLPEAVDWLPYLKVAGGKLELRCANNAESSQQDVLPPTIHPETGQPYEWGGAGDWRNLPALPEAVLDVWLQVVAEQAPAAPRPPSSDQSGVIGAFNSAHDPGEILERNGYRRAGNRWLAPDSTSATPGVVRLPDTEPTRVYSHHGADPLATGHSHDAFSVLTILEHGGDARAAYKAVSRAPGQVPQPDFSGITADAPGEGVINPNDLLPDFPEELIALPHGLGDIQAWIYGRMIYPSQATAGITAMATLTAFAQSHITVDSFGGLGLNEQYLVLAPTGMGKEDLRSPVTVLADEVGVRPRLNLSRVQWSVPSSLQGLHALLESHAAQFFLSDEFAEWLAQTGHDPHKQAALGYMMQLYTKALATVNAPAAVTRSYGPVKNPRVSVLATSTPDRILETMTLSHADSGAYNRWVIFVAEQERLAKRYTGLEFEPPQNVIELVGKVAAYPETQMMFSKDAWRYFMDRDSKVIEPLKFEDNHLAGRLSEQAIKMAALVALSDLRIEITADDLRIAYAVREGLYHRVRVLADYDGAISGMHVTGQALEQVRGVLRRHKSIRKCHLANFSRKYKGLSVQERNAVLAALYDSGEIADVKDHKGLLASQICEL